MSSILENETDHWQQIHAGIELLKTSKLCVLESGALRFTPVDESEFEFSEHGHRSIHPVYGRLLCWITFSTGAEYLIKGALLITGANLVQEVQIITPPSWLREAMPIGEWIEKVVEGNPSVKETGISFGELGNLPYSKLNLKRDDRFFVQAAYSYLRSAIRNRDAHRFEENVRAAHFVSIPELFVPAFNLILNSLNQNRLEQCIHGYKNEIRYDDS